MSAPTPLRRELLIAFGILFTAAFLGAGLAIGLILPLLASFGQTLLFVVILVVAHLLILFLLGGAFLRTQLLEPLEELAADARRIAEGDYRHRIRPADSLELESVRASVNAMADRLIHDQRLLAENVESLDQTNRELVEARDQVIQAARLASVGTLAAGIAHEVGNPLGAIMVFVDIGRKRAVGEGCDPGMFEAIREEAHRIDRIVRGLLDYARPRDEEAGPVPPASVLERVRDLLQSQGKLDQVEHRWHLDESVPRVVMEPHRLEQVLVNLVLNALDALQDREKPVLEIRLGHERGEVEDLPARREGDPPGVNYMHRRRVSRTEPGGGVSALFTARRVVVIQVSDNGPGIPAEDREAIFDLFFTTKEPGKGTGLGLSICARLVEGMGGRIEAGESELGGARFTIRLPGYPEEDA